ncbi:hypothetical protein POM88_006372 [Heracleum sosnowskyi]|uniref:Uncharacterized protein n=1 Tax=Heracleum sosnowskyi TaxID=360622 RepID=A0AAD8J465_9APIA|nr:hypothetical protein POM88_006372 [Heracleum sosnowskyi]
MAYDHIRELDDAVDKFMESSNFLVTDDVYGDIDIETLEEATRRLDYLICQEGALPYYPCSDVVERLLHIWDYKELQYPQHMAASILSSAMFDDCCESIINEKAVPVLVKVINHSPTETTKMVVKTLTHLACKSSDHIPLIVSHGGLEAAHEFVSNCTPGTFRVVRSLAKLLAAVCRGTNLSLDKEQIAITISQNLFQKKWYTSSTTHIKEACYALTFLSYEKPAVITKEVCESIVKFLYHDDEFVVASALGVFGNIVRWGHGYQIQMKKLEENLPTELEDILNRKFDTETELLHTRQDADKSGLLKEVPHRETELVRESGRVGAEGKHQIVKVGSQSMEMLQVRAALEEKLKQKCFFSSVAPEHQKAKRDVQPLNGQIEVLDDFDDNTSDIRGREKRNGHSQLSHSATLSKIATQVKRAKVDKSVSVDENMGIHKIIRSNG